eukprot:gene25679-11345_t
MRFSRRDRHEHGSILGAQCRDCSGLSSSRAGNTAELIFEGAGDIPHEELQLAIELVTQKLVSMLEGTVETVLVPDVLTSAAVPDSIGHFMAAEAWFARLPCVVYDAWSMDHGIKFLRTMFIIRLTKVTEDSVQVSHLGNSLRHFSRVVRYRACQQALIRIDHKAEQSSNGMTRMSASTQLQKPTKSIRRIVPQKQQPAVMPLQQPQEPGMTSTVSHPVSISPDGAETWEVDSIVDVRQFGSDMGFRVRWKGFSREQDTWEPLEHLDRAPLVMENWKIREALRALSTYDSSKEAESSQKAQKLANDEIVSRDRPTPSTCISNRELTKWKRTQRMKAQAGRNKKAKKATDHTVPDRS